MERPLFSIIVPVYKVSQYIDCCVESILNQKFSDFEVLLVDDGSPDECPLICDSYAKRDNRVKVIHKKNGGIVSSRQAGAEAAKGEYVCCVDGDDWISLDYLSKFAEAIRENQPDIVCCRAFWAYPDHQMEAGITAPYGFYDRRKMEKEIFPVLIESKNGQYFAPSLWAKAFRRDLFLKNMMTDCMVHIGEDNACVKSCIFWARGMTLLQDPMYYYRQNPVSVTKSKKAFGWEMPGLVSRHFESHIPMMAFDFQQQVYRNLVHNLFIVACSQFNKDLSYREIKKEICSWVSSPYYKNAIQQSSCAPSYYKGLLAKWSLKYKWVFLMRLYHKILYR